MANKLSASAEMKEGAFGPQVSVPSRGELLLPSARGGPVEADASEAAACEDVVATIRALSDGDAAVEKILTDLMSYYESLPPEPVTFAEFIKFWNAGVRHQSPMNHPFKVIRFLRLDSAGIYALSVDSARNAEDKNISESEALYLALLSLQNQSYDPGL